MHSSPSLGTASRTVRCGAELPPLPPDDIDSSDLTTERRRRPWGALLAVLAIFGLTALAFGAELLAPESPQGGEDLAPDFSLPSLQVPGDRVSLDLARGRPVVLNFWASSCEPCRRELPAIAAVAEDFGDGVAFLGVNHLDNRGDALNFLGSIDVELPTGYDPEGRVAPTYGVRGMPTTIFIDSSGAIVARHTGEITERQLREQIAKLLDR